MKDGVKADARNEIQHLIRNLCMVVEGKMIADVKAARALGETIDWLIETFEGIARELKAFKVKISKELK